MFSELGLLSLLAGWWIPWRVGSKRLAPVLFMPRSVRSLVMDCSPFPFLHWTGDCTPTLPHHLPYIWPIWSLWPSPPHAKRLWSLGPSSRGCSNMWTGHRQMKVWENCKTAAMDEQQFKCGVNIFLYLGNTEWQLITVTHINKCC